MRKYLITGAGSPLGCALREEINSRGDCWLGVFNVGGDEASSSAAITPNESIFCDLANQEDVFECIEQVNKSPNLDAFVHLAATTSMNDKSIQELNRQFNINTLSGWIIADACIQAMSKKDGGRILFAGSVGHKFGGKVNQWGYGASKYLLEYFPKSFRLCARDNVLVNTLRLGVMAGGTQDKQGITDVTFAKRVELIPTGRHLAHAEAVKIVLDLVSMDNCSIHNAVVECTGGE